MTDGGSDRPARVRRPRWRAGRCRAALLWGLAAVAAAGNAAATTDPRAATVATATATAPTAAPLHLTTALHLVVDEGDAPLLTAPVRQLDWRDLPGAWQSITLPQAPGRPWAVAATVAPPAPGATTRTSWYRWRLPARPVGDEALALYAARVRSDGPVAVYLDGQLVHLAQREGQRWTSARTPLWAALAGPTVAAANAANRPDPAAHDLLIGLRHSAPGAGTGALAETGTGIGGGATATPAATPAAATTAAARLVTGASPMLSTVRVGAPDALAWRDQTRRWLQRDLPMLGSAAFLTVGLYSLVVWLLRRSDRGYLLFFALSVASFLRTLQVHADRPIAPDAFAWLTLNALFWVLALGHVFITGLHQQPQRGLDATLLVVTAAVGVLTWPALGSARPALAGAADGLVLAMGATVAAVGWARCRGRSREGQWVSAGIGLCVLMELSDRLPAGALLPAEGVPLGAYGGVVTFAVFAHLMYRRFAAALQQVAQTHRQLAQRLQQREADLTETHRQLREVEQQQTRTQERQRLMQDMHDGLGSSLHIALQSVVRGPVDEAAVRHLLRGCVDDLRLTIDSMEPVDADLLLLLATLRYRLGGRLKAAGIQLRWEVSDLPRLDWLDPRCALHILRILQETLSNSIQHARATEIHFHTAFDAQWVRVQITDDGPGFDLGAALRSGHQGLVTQQRRAQAMGAHVGWQPDPATGSGSRMTLSLPRLGQPGPLTG